MNSHLTHKYSCLPARFGTPSRAAATAAVAATAAPATTAELRLRARLVHHEGPPAHVRAVELLDGRLGILFRLHFDERKAACAASCVVPHHPYRLDGPRLTEQILQLTLSRREREISDEQLPTHVTTPTE